MGIVDWGRTQNGELQKCFGVLQEYVNDADMGWSFDEMRTIPSWLVMYCRISPLSCTGVLSGGERLIAVSGR